MKKAEREIVAQLIANAEQSGVLSDYGDKLVKLDPKLKPPLDAYRELYKMDGVILGGRDI